MGDFFFPVRLYIVFFIATRDFNSVHVSSTNFHTLRATLQSIRLCHPDPCPSENVNPVFSWEMLRVMITHVVQVLLRPCNHDQRTYYGSDTNSLDQLDLLVI